MCPAGRDVRGRQYRVGFGVVAGMAGSAVLAAIAAVLLARRLADPLSDVAARAARLGAGDYRTSPARPGIDELDRICDVLDRAAARSPRSSSGSAPSPTTCPTSCAAG